MPNWTYTMAKITGTKENIDKLEEAMKIRNTKKHCTYMNDIVKQTTAKNWLGLILLELGLTLEQIDIAGDMRGFYHEPTRLNETTLQFWSEDAWNVKTDFYIQLETLLNAHIVLNNDSDEVGMLNFETPLIESIKGVK